MVHQYMPNFPHRLNPDGSYDSVCTLCLSTVATAKSERELTPHEKNHICDELHVYQVSQFARRGMSLVLR
jgi:hypothetical protein